jgi:hypothetical protein
MMHVNAQAWRANRTPKSNGTNIEDERRFIEFEKGTFFKHFARSAEVFLFNKKKLRMQAFPIT